MYRSRLGGGQDRAAAAYLSSEAGDAGIFAYDVLGSQAHVVMLHGRGLMSRADARRALLALAAVRRRGAPRAGADDVHEAVEAEVARRAGAAGRRMHAGRSRNDQVAADMRMRLRDDIASLCGALLGLAGELVEAASRHRRTVVPLYTHMQRAQAGTLSHYLLAHADAFMRDVERLLSAHGRVNLSPLGAGPAGGTSVPVDRAEAARLLGFAGVVENSLDATSSRDFAAEYASCAAIMMCGASRLAEDLVLWSTSEFGFVELDDSLASPSSIMPQKKNPDVLELTRGKAAVAASAAAAVMGVTKGLATGYGRDLQEIKPLLWSLSADAAGAAAVLRAAVATMSVDAAAMRRAASGGGHLEALDVAERLAAGGLPFRDAHAAAAALVREAARRGVPLRRLTARQARAALSGSPADARAAAAAIRGATPAASLRARASAGSAGYREQARMVASRRRRAGDLRSEVAARERAAAAGLAELASRVAAITRGGAAAARGRGSGGATRRRRGRAARRPPRAQAAGRGRRSRGAPRALQLTAGERGAHRLKH